MECQLSEVSGLAVRDTRILLAVPEAELQLESCLVVFIVIIRRVGILLIY